MLFVLVWSLTETSRSQAGGRILPETPEMVPGPCSPGLSWVQWAIHFPTAAYSQQLVRLVDTHLSSLSGGWLSVGLDDKASSPGYFLAVFAFTPKFTKCSWTSPCLGTCFWETSSLHTHWNPTLGCLSLDSASGKLGLEEGPGGVARPLEPRKAVMVSEPQCTL